MVPTVRITNKFSEVDCQTNSAKMEKDQTPMWDSKFVKCIITHLFLHTGTWQTRILQFSPQVIVKLYFLFTSWLVFFVRKLWLSYQKIWWFYWHVMWISVVVFEKLDGTDASPVAVNIVAEEPWTSDQHSSGISSNKNHHRNLILLFNQKIIWKYSVKLYFLLDLSVFWHLQGMINQLYGYSWFSALKILALLLWPSQAWHHCQKFGQPASFLQMLNQQRKFHNMLQIML